MQQRMRCARQRSFDRLQVGEVWLSIRVREGSREVLARGSDGTERKLCHCTVVGDQLRSCLNSVPLSLNGQLDVRTQHCAVPQVLISLPIWSRHVYAVAKAYDHKQYKMMADHVDAGLTDTKVHAIE